MYLNKGGGVMGSGRILDGSIKATEVRRWFEDIEGKSKAEVIFILVSKYNWFYEDACDFADKYNKS